MDVEIAVDGKFGMVMCFGVGESRIVERGKV